MKFQCDRCKTRYSIADERVRGKVLRVRCKSCAHAITVREGMSADPAAPAASRPRNQTIELSAAATASDEDAPWYLSVDGAQIGPFTDAEALRRVAAKQPDDDMHVWRDDFDGWKPVEDVPALTGALPRVPPPPPAKPAPRGPAVPLPLPDVPSAPIAKAADPVDNLDFAIGEVSRVVRIGDVLAPPRPTLEPRPVVTRHTPTALVAAADPSEPAAGGVRRTAVWVIVAVSVAVAAAGAIILATRGDDDRPAPPRAVAELHDSDLVTNFYARENPVVPAPVVPATQPTTLAAAPTTAPARPTSPTRPGAGVAPPGALLEDQHTTHMTPAAPEHPAHPERPEKVDSFDDNLGHGSLTPDDVRNAYAANEVGLKRCYERALKEDPTTNIAKMDVTITIAPAGVVSSVKVPSEGPLGTCVANSVRTWRFRRSSSDFTSEFTVVFAKR